MGVPELLDELDELELLEELVLLEELELLDELDELELLDELDELDELEDELVSMGPPPPHPVSREAHSTKVSEGVEIADFIGIIFILHLMSLL